MTGIQFYAIRQAWLRSQTPRIVCLVCQSYLPYAGAVLAVMALGEILGVTCPDCCPGVDQDSLNVLGRHWAERDGLSHRLGDFL
jgi:hypothetical protein